MKNTSILILVMMGSINLSAQFTGAPGNIYYNTGYVGIGVTAPASVLHINSSSERQTFRIYRNGNTNNYLSIYQGTNGAALDPIGTGNLWLGYDQPTNVYMGLNGSKIGVGTTIPDALLTVKGLIHAEEVKIDLAVPGPDYVFEPAYKLPSLEEVSNFIKANKHLPEVPSACAMEENGVNVGEMNMLMLKKIEELTLYIIELKKEMEKQQEEIDQLKNRTIDKMIRLK